MSDIKRIFIRSITFSIFLTVMSIGSTHAQNFTFEFKNPGFGGHPSNFQYFMQTANSQKPDFSDSDETSGFRRDPLQDFERTLERQILSQISRELTIGDSQVDFSEDGTYELGDYQIEVRSQLDVINVSIRDLLSGESTQVQIPRF